MTGSKSKASEGASQSVPRTVSSSSSSSSSLSSSSSSSSSLSSDNSYNFFVKNKFCFISDFGDSDDSDGQIGIFHLDEEAKKIVSIGEPAICSRFVYVCFFFLFNPACLSLA